MKRTMIAIPCMDMVHTAFLESLLSLRRENCSFSIAKASLVYDARNILAQKAIEEGYDRVLWLDSDMVFPEDMFYRLSEDLDNGYGFVSGICFTRKQPIKPVIYSDMGYEELNDGSGMVKTYTVCMEDYPKDSIFEVKGIGFGAVMIETSILADVYRKFGAPFFPVAGFGEDFSFCRRCDELGIKMFCDSRVKVGHIANTVVSESAYLSGYHLLGLE